MNCETCDHKVSNDDPKFHCYMFKEEMVDCRQHTERKKCQSNEIIQGALDILAGFSGHTSINRDYYHDDY